LPHPARFKPVLAYARHFAKGRRFVILDSYTKAQLYDTDAPT
jgi:hypothetical protein